MNEVAGVSAQWARRSNTGLPARGLGRGQSLVEMALAMPVLLTALMVLVEAGRLFYLSMTLQDAARAGAAYGAESLTTDNDVTGMQQVATADAQNITGSTWWGSPTNFSASATHFCQCADGSASTCAVTDCSGQTQSIYVEVDTYGQFTPMLNYPGVPAAVRLHGRAIIRVQ